MFLPTRLQDTTLGDLLAELNRAGVSGVLELHAPNGVVHRVGLESGKVSSVESPLGPKLGDVLAELEGARFGSLVERVALGPATAPLGEQLLAQNLIGKGRLGRALAVQCERRLEALFKLERARIVFRVARQASFGTHLEPKDYLSGKPRHRTRNSSQDYSRPPSSGSAWEVLGLPPGADADAIRAAFRRHAAPLHPDRHGDKTPRERAELERQYLRLNAAYRTLVA
ncbi:MAG TPA: J domain-containing protein [Polyangiaceae bacterium]|jgi:hypothetical protein|nr:J domain-containing protein [Polyangiaceae bacterium]